MQTQNLQESTSSNTDGSAAPITGQAPGELGAAQERDLTALTSRLAAVLLRQVVFDLASQFDDTPPPLAAVRASLADDAQWLVRKVTPLEACLDRGQDAVIDSELTAVLGNAHLHSQRLQVFRRQQAISSAFQGAIDSSPKRERFVDTVRTFCAALLRLAALLPQVSETLSEDTIESEFLADQAEFAGVTLRRWPGRR